MDKYLINSVLGFDLKTEVVDQNGEPIKTGIRTTYFSKESPKRSSAHLCDKKFFTNFNEDLLAKIKDFRSINE